MLLNICITKLDEVGLICLRAGRLVLIGDRWFSDLNTVPEFLDRVKVLRENSLSTMTRIKPGENYYL